MKSLNVIQKLSKIGKILSKIIFICSLVGFFMCIVGIISVALGSEEVLVWKGVTIHSILSNIEGYSEKMLYGFMAVGIIECGSEAIISKLAEFYFKHELEAGTPFTVDGANELRKLGIITIVISVVSSIIVSILVEGMNLWNDKVLDNSTSITLGITFIIVSIILSYGAEVLEINKKHENIELE